MRKLTTFLAFLVVVLPVSALWAQQEPPLAEVARREAERRKTVQSSTKVYTNADVKRGAPLTTAAEKPAPPPDATPAAGAQPKPAAPPAQAPGEPVKDEAWWRKQMNDTRDQLNRSRLFGEALQSRINALWADFTARDDPAQRAVIERDRQKALAELERVKGEIAQREQDLQTLEEDARKAGVPPGWLR